MKHGKGVRSCVILTLLLPATLQAKSMFYKVVAANVKQQLSYYCYTGQEKEGKLYNYRARMYDSKLRRFLSSDKMKEDDGSYTYVSNNPVSYVDLNGMWKWQSLCSYSENREQADKQQNQQIENPQIVHLQQVVQQKGLFYDIAKKRAEDQLLFSRFWNKRIPSSVNFDGMSVTPKEVYKVLSSFLSKESTLPNRPLYLGVADPVAGEVPPGWKPQGQKTKGVISESDYYHWSNPFINHGHSTFRIALNFKNQALASNFAHTISGIIDDGSNVRLTLQMTKIKYQRSRYGKIDLQVPYQLIKWDGVVMYFKGKYSSNLANTLTVLLNPTDLHPFVGPGLVPILEMGGVGIGQDVASGSSSTLNIATRLSVYLKNVNKEVLSPNKFIDALYEEDIIPGLKKVADDDVWCNN